MTEEIRLTRFSKSSGCGCKIAPAVLDGILGGETLSVKPGNLLVGIESKDDAAVVALNETDCIISTVDFFTPIVDDPFDFGRIAAANAISDVYSMGGRPLTAISVLGFPVDKLPADMVREIIRGGMDTCRKAGISIAGGHSIDAPEPFFGLSVTGLVTKEHLKRNNTALAGHHLYLTKPLGTGILSAAMKKDLLEENERGLIAEYASRLNNAGELLGQLPFVSAMTDVTGFGLLGHLLEICEGSRLNAEITFTDIPKIAGIDKYIASFCMPDNTYRNWNAWEKKVQGITAASFGILNDPQTNGGLLFTAEPGHEETLKKILESCGNLEWKCIGTITPDSGTDIVITVV